MDTQQAIEHGTKKINQLASQIEEGQPYKCEWLDEIEFLDISLRAIREKQARENSESQPENTILAFERPGYCNECTRGDLTLNTSSLFATVDGIEQVCEIQYSIGCKHDDACKRMHDVFC